MHTKIAFITSRGNTMREVQQKGMINVLFCLQVGLRLATTPRSHMAHCKPWNSSKLRELQLLSVCSQISRSDLRFNASSSAQVTDARFYANDLNVVFLHERLLHPSFTERNLFPLLVESRSAVTAVCWWFAKKLLKSAWKAEVICGHLCAPLR